MSDAKKDGGHHAPAHGHGEKHHDHHGPHWLEIIVYGLVWIVVIQVVGSVLLTAVVAIIENKKPGYDLRLVSPQGRALIATVTKGQSTTAPTTTPKTPCEDIPFTPVVAPGNPPGMPSEALQWSADPTVIPEGHTLDRNPNVNPLDAPYWMLCTPRVGTPVVWDGACPGQIRQVQFTSKTAEAVSVSVRVCPKQK